MIGTQRGRARDKRGGAWRSWTRNGREIARRDHERDERASSRCGFGRSVWGRRAAVLYTDREGTFTSCPYTERRRTCAGGHAWNVGGGAWRERARNGRAVAWQGVAPDERVVARLAHTQNGPGSAQPRWAPKRRGSSPRGRTRNKVASARRDRARNGRAVPWHVRTPDKRGVAGWCRKRSGA